MSKRVTLWAELITTRDRYGFPQVQLGKLMRREPKNREGFFVKVSLVIPSDLELVARAEIS